MSAAVKPPSCGSGGGSTGGAKSHPSSSSATEATHSSSCSSSSGSSDEERSVSSRSRSRSQSHSGTSRSSSSSSGTSSRSSRSRGSCRDDADERKGDGATPRKLPRVEGVGKATTSGTTESIGRPVFPLSNTKSIFPAPRSAPSGQPPPPTSQHTAASLPPPPRYGPAFGAWAPPPPPPLPTLSASTKDITEMDVRAGVRLGVFRAATLLNKEQVMDEVESVRMTSSVEKVLLEPWQSAGLPGVPVEEREYAWATVFFADAEAAELCVARFCQPGRRSKWSRVCIQRLPVTSLTTTPLSAAEDQRYRVHAYQLESAADASPGISAVTTSALPDAVLARAASGWCVLSTGALFPTLGLAHYLKCRRNGDFSSVAVCSAFDADAEQDTCDAGGQCSGLHLREGEQWKLLLPVVLPMKASVGTSPHLKPLPASAAPVAMAETRWLTARHLDTLVVKPLPSDIDESGFVYMFRGCKGFLRGQTVRTVDQVRYGVVQFADAASAQAAWQQATATTQLPVCLYKDSRPVTVLQGKPTTGSSSAEGGGVTETTQGTSATDAAPDHNVVARETSNDVVSIPENTRGDTEDGGEVGVTHAPDVPFPPLPEDWEYGLSRRTMQYFFLQSGKKSTTWKHPVTQEQYKAKR